MKESQRCAQACGPRLVILVLLTSLQMYSQVQRKEQKMNYRTLYRTTQIDGLSIFYREAGPKEAPTLLLLHGLPSSSRMFEPLLRGSPIAITWWRRIIQGLGIATGPTQRNSRTHSITTRR